VQHADDPGRPLVGRRLQAEALDQRLVGGHAGERDRARVRDVGQQRAEGDDHLHAERLGEVDDLPAERAPLHRGLRAAEQHEVARRARDERLVDLELRPLDTAREALDEAHARARGLVVDELLRVDHREARRVEAGAHEGQRRGGALAGVVPALEGADERGGAEPVGTAFPAQRLHRSTVASRASRPGARR
jgi:hypothetical protein